MIFQIKLLRNYIFTFYLLFAAHYARQQAVACFQSPAPARQLGQQLSTSLSSVDSPPQLFSYLSKHIYLHFTVSVQSFLHFIVTVQSYLLKMARLSFVSLLSLSLLFGQQAARAQETYPTAGGLFR